VSGARVPGWAVGALLLAATSACGVPTGGAPDPIPTAEVPTELAAPSTPAASTPSAPTVLDQPQVALLTEDGVLVPRGRSVPSGPVVDRLDDLLDDLAAGPTPAELTDRLSTALRPDTTLSVGELSGSTATIDLDGSAEAPTGQESRRAVAQIVLTATSLPGVQAVLLTRDGQPVEAPLPAGELTSRPLTAGDYASLLTPAPTPTS